MIHLGDVVALLVGHRTCSAQVAGSSPGWRPPRSGLGPATYTSVTNQSNMVPAKGQRYSLAGKVTSGLEESNGMRASVGLSSALWKNDGSDADAVWHHRSDVSRDEAGSGVWGSVHGKGYFLSLIHI